MKSNWYLLTVSGEELVQGQVREHRGGTSKCLKQRGCGEAYRSDGVRGRGSGIRLPKFTFWLCCMTLDKPSCSWNTPGLKKDKFPGGDDARWPEYHAIWRPSEIQRCPGSKQDNYCSSCLGGGTLLEDRACPWSAWPYPVSSSEWIRNNGSEDTTLELCFICHFPYLFLLLSPFCPSPSHVTKWDIVLIFGGSNKGETPALQAG